VIIPVHRRVTNMKAGPLNVIFHYMRH